MASINVSLININKAELVLNLRKTGCKKIREILEIYRDLKTKCENTSEGVVEELFSKAIDEAVELERCEELKVTRFFGYNRAVYKNNHLDKFQ